VLSKDTFEHVGDPEGYIAEMRRLAAPGGLIVIGFGPLWKSPFGGHIDFMTGMPWAHLLFPEGVIMQERRRFRPDEDARRFEDIKGGLNRMTLERFETIMAGSGLRCRSFATNRSDSRLVQLMKAPSALPAQREYFTSNVYGVWDELAAETA
jgi:SAM-dependent methyltransferase